jgi:hypothetical protein
LRLAPDSSHIFAVIAVSKALAGETGSSHPFGIDMVWHDIVIVCELLVANCAYSVLLYNLPIYDFPHLRG